MKCPYDLKECDQIDTSGMTMLKECKDCERHNDWIRPTGGLPDNKGCLYTILISITLWILIISFN